MDTVTPPAVWRDTSPPVHRYASVVLAEVFMTPVWNRPVVRGRAEHQLVAAEHPVDQRVPLPHLGSTEGGHCRERQQTRMTLSDDAALTQHDEQQGDGQSVGATNSCGHASLWLVTIPLHSTGAASHPDDGTHRVRIPV